VCTYISHQASISGSGKGGGRWSQLSHLTVSFDHPVSAQLGHGVLIDFQNPGAGAAARIGLELDIASATALARLLQQTIEQAELSGLAE
jgi:hypothetical protein